MASSARPPIPGFHLFPSALPLELQHSLAAALSSSVWPNNSNQVMLFTSSTSPHLPAYLSPLLDFLPSLLSPNLPPDLLDLILQSKLPRQAILNLYRPGSGITPHIDLPHRYEDGIVGVSLGGSAVMDFTRDEQIYSVLLRPGDVYVLSGESRFQWQHGIAYREEDWVRDGEGGEPFLLRRRTRMSVTLRRMKRDGHVVGEGDYQVTSELVEAGIGEEEGRPAICECRGRLRGHPASGLTLPLTQNPTLTRRIREP